METQPNKFWQAHAKMKISFKQEIKRSFSFTCEPLEFLKKIPSEIWKAVRLWFGF